MVRPRSARAHIGEHHGVEDAERGLGRRLRRRRGRVVVRALARGRQELPPPALERHKLLDTHAALHRRAARVQHRPRQPLHAAHAGVNRRHRAGQPEEVLRHAINVHIADSGERGLAADAAKPPLPRRSPASRAPLIDEGLHARIVRTEELAAVVKLEGIPWRRVVIRQHPLVALTDPAVRGAAARATPPLIEDRDGQACLRQRRRRDRTGDAASNDSHRLRHSPRSWLGRRVVAQNLSREAVGGKTCTCAPYSF